jgi:hypothetical protein
MHKYLFAAVALAITLVAPAQAKSPKVLNTKVDLYERFGQPASMGSSGDVVIDSVTVNRTQPAESGDPVTVSPDHSDTQIGWHKKKNKEYLIILEATDIEQFVRDAITIGFNRAGYAVVPAGSSQAASASHVKVEVKSLWMWVVSVEKDWSNKQFHFNISTVVTSDAPAMLNIGTVKGHGFRNGSRDTNWKSYRNTALHSMKFFINNFAESVTASIVAHESKDNAEVINPLDD